MADPLDIFGAWREAMQRWEQETNTALNAATSSEQYSQASNQALSLMARLQARQAEATERALNLANLPSKADFRALNGRLDDLEAQISTLTELVRRTAPETPVVRPMSPPRTRKPPEAAQVSAAPKGKPLPKKGASS